MALMGSRQCGAPTAGRLTSVTSQAALGAGTFVGLPGGVVVPHPRTQQHHRGVAPNRPGSSCQVKSTSTTSGSTGTVRSGVIALILSRSSGRLICLALRSAVSPASRCSLEARL
jgi:hypothetical protein